MPTAQPHPALSSIFAAASARLIAPFSSQALTPEAADETRIDWYDDAALGKCGLIWKVPSALEQLGSLGGEALLGAALVTTSSPSDREMLSLWVFCGLSGPASKGFFWKKQDITGGFLPAGKGVIAMNARLVHMLERGQFPE